MSEPVLLASASPRRSELLAQIGVAHRVQSVDIDETPGNDEGPESYVRRLAIEKARAGARAPAGAGVTVLGADTAVIVDGAILGKPLNNDHALDMLQRLSGRTHAVATAVAVVLDAYEDCIVQTSEVEFAPLEEARIRAYVATNEGRDKAGAYAVQGLAARFIRRISGSYSGIMGLPLFETAALLEAAARAQEPLR